MISFRKTDHQEEPGGPGGVKTKAGKDKQRGQHLPEGRTHQDQTTCSVVLRTSGDATYPP